MFPDKQKSDNCNLSKILATCHRETQTKKTILKDSGSLTDSLQRPSDSINKADKDSLKSFEFSQIIKESENSNSITVIKDSFTEETHDHSNAESLSDDAIANRYKYCREIIKPYLKSYPQGCSQSDEKLIQDTLNSINDDFPDYRSCFEIFGSEKKSSSSIASSNKIGGSTCTFRSKSSCIKNSCDSLTTIETPKCNNSSNNNCKQKSICTPKTSKKIVCPPKDSKLKKPICVSKTSMSSDSKNKDPKKDCPPPEEKSPCKKKTKCPPPIDDCSEKQTSKQDLPAVSCTKSDHTLKCKDRILIEACEEKPSKKNGVTSSSHSCNLESAKTSHTKTCKPCSSHDTLGEQKSILDIHGETITTIKVAAEDFFGKVFKMTKDAVTVITTESVRHLNKITPKKSETDNNESAPITQNENNAGTISGFNFFHSSNIQEEKKGECPEERTKMQEIVKNIATKVNSTITVISDQIHTVASSMLKSKNFNDNSSPYDKPVPPEEISNRLQESAPTPSNVFTVIKSKICSMFYETENQKDLSRTPSTSSTDSDISKKEADTGLFQRCNE
ncbi:uncharacterized protein LOC113521054 [Galleria mellonella]|uniref:Uncharacterized protein LOC113521054 n=1 Tax=Galleria mellonella TaxID=7137 RepID=A0A6J3BYD5_GALME|nr:uncharacterized protein LOC113521054 [Galleria mellonella]